MNIKKILLVTLIFSTEICTAANKDKMTTSWKAVSSQSKGFKKCGNVEKPALFDTGLVYDIQLDHPVISNNHNFYHKVIYYFYECKNSNWTAIVPGGDIFKDVELAVAVGTFWNSSGAPKEEDIRIRMPIETQGQFIRKSLGLILTDNQKDDYRGGFDTDFKLKYFLIKKDMSSVGQFLLSKYDVNIVNQVNTGDTQEDVDPRHAYYCGEVELPPGLIDARDASDPNEADGNWYYRTQDLEISNFKDILRVQYRLIAVECKERESDRKYYWNNVAFRRDTESFIGKFDGYFSWYDYSRASSGLEQSDLLSRYIEISNSAHGLLQSHEVSPVTVVHEIPVAELLTAAKWKEYQQGAITNVQMSLGIRSNYIVIPGAGPQGGAGVMNLIQYPFFKSDFFIHKNDTGILRPITDPRENSGASGDQKNFKLWKNWESHLIENKISTPKPDRSWDRCEFNLYKSPSGKDFTIEFNLRFTRPDKAEVILPIHLGQYELNALGEVDLSNLTGAPTKDGSLEYGPWAKYENGKLTAARSKTLSNGDKAIFRIDAEVSKSLDKIDEILFRLAITHEGQAYLDEWLICKDLRTNRF